MSVSSGVGVGVVSSIIGVRVVIIGIEVVGSAVTMRIVVLSISIGAGVSSGVGDEVFCCHYENCGTWHQHWCGHQLRCR